MTSDVMTFSMPTAEAVERALRELEWGERLTGYSMTPSAGNGRVDLYSLPDAIRFLLGTSWDAPLLLPGHKGGINWVDVHLLSGWLSDVVGDVELGTVVEERVVGMEPYQAQMVALGEIFTERMGQYREVRAETQAGTEEPPTE